MEGLVMNYLDDDFPTDEVNVPIVQPGQLLTENWKDLENSIPLNEFATNLEHGTKSVSIEEGNTFQNEETSPQIDAISSIVILKVESVRDTADSSLSLNTLYEEELPSDISNTATINDTQKIVFKCDNCAFIGKSRFALARHNDKCKPAITSKVAEDKKYSDVITFNCDVCDFFAISRFALARHKNCHQQKADIAEDKKPIIFKCEICSFMAKSRFALARHQEEHDEDSEIEAEKCVSVEATNQIIPIMRVFRCRWCHFTSKFRFALKRHVLHHKKPDTFTCPRCYNLVLTRLKSEHLSKCKKKCEHYACDNCPYKTVYRKMFVRHQSTCKKELLALEVPAIQQHQTTVTNDSNNIFTTKFHDTLTHHLEGHKSGQPHNKDPKVTSTSQQHQTILENESNYECKYCSFTTKIHETLTNHLKSHESGQPYYKVPPTVQQHQTNEKNESKYEGKYCSSTTKIGETLTNHLKSHVSGQPYIKDLEVRLTVQHHQTIILKNESNYECEHCSFTTKIHETLTKHMKSHESGQPHNKDLEVPATVRKHETIVKNESNYECKYCLFKTNIHETLTNHLKSHESEQGHIEDLEVPANVQLSETTVKVESNYECKYCSFTTKFHWTFSGHMKSHYSGRPIFKCKKCNFKSTYSSVSRHHCLNYSYVKNNAKMNRRRAKEVLQCDQCTFKTSLMAAWHEHLTKHGKTGKSREAFRTNWKTTLENHLREHDDNDPFGCKRGSFKTELKNADMAPHKKEIAMSGKTSQKINNTTKNVRSAQIGKREYKCKYCSHTCNSTWAFNEHLGKHKNLKLPVYTCDKCEFNGFKNTLAKHMISKHDGERIERKKCPSCSYFCYGSRDLERHLRQKHPIAMSEKFKCHLCAYSTKQKNNLKRHLDTHDNKKIKTYKIKSLKVKSKNKAGTLIKVGNKFCCDLCSYATLRKPRIENHRDILHSKDYPLFQCTLCEYKSFRWLLTRHYRNVHNKVDNQALYYCKLCSFSSQYKQSLRYHTRTQHVLRKSDMYECDYCEFKSTKYSLFLHLKSVHGQSKNKS